MPIKIDGTNGVLEAYDFQVFTSGFSYTFPSGTQTLIINPAATLAGGTITMPASPVDGMVITITTTQQITALTLNGNTGQSIGGTQTTQMPANSAISFVYRLANTTWYRISAPAIGNIGTAPVYAARAWVYFNGTGVVSINGTGNVTSITDNGTGDYTVNFTTAMPDANYFACPMPGSGGTVTGAVGTTSQTASAYRMTYTNTAGGNADSSFAGVAIFR